jgi:hypothetical protein
MNLLKTLLRKKEEPVTTYEDFWNWFCKNAPDFYTVVKTNGNIEKAFFGKLAPKLAGLNEGFYFMTGMYDEQTVELVFTADGDIKNIPFVEELVAAAPKIDGWMFTALKPALNINDVTIRMADYDFKKENMSFYANELPDYPDEIDITVVHDDLSEENRDTIVNGTHIFLDNVLGELDFASTIDNLQVVGKAGAQKELVPIEKLKPYLTWREKEFIEKYEGLRRNTENDEYSAYEATLKDGKPLIAIMNTNLLDWDSKASHPWILNIGIKYNGKGNNGMPDNETYQLLNALEEDINKELHDSDGYLNLGRQTADSSRHIYFACKDFRKPSKVLHGIQKQYAGRLDLSYDIYKDKYWQSFERFR